MANPYAIGTKEWADWGARAAERDSSMGSGGLDLPSEAAYPSAPLPPSLAAMVPADGGGGIAPPPMGGAVLSSEPPSAPNPEMGGGGGGPQPGAAPEVLAGPTGLRQGIGNRIPPSLAALLKPRVY